MKIKEIIIEGYKETQEYFIKMNGDPSLTTELINKFRVLVNKNQVSGNERNIDWWRKQGWDKFAEFVDNESYSLTNTQLKRKKIDGKSVTLLDNDEWFVVVPLDRNASCFHGKNTDWCVTKQNNDFAFYFNLMGGILIYCIHKQSKMKWAISFQLDKWDEAEYYDQSNSYISEETFIEETGLDPDDFFIMIRNMENDNDSPFYVAKQQYQKMKKEITEYLNQESITRNKRIERMIVEYGSLDFTIEYVRKLGYQKMATDPIFYEIQTEAVTNDDTLVRNIINPDEKMQYRLISYDKSNIQYITNPSESIQKKIIDYDADLLKYIQNPTLRIQAIAVSKDGNNIEYIKNPSEKIQMIAVAQYHMAIWYIENPTPKVLAYVEKKEPDIRRMLSKREMINTL